MSPFPTDPHIEGAITSRIPNQAQRPIFVILFLPYLVIEVAHFWSNRNLHQRWACHEVLRDTACNTATGQGQRPFILGIELMMLPICLPRNRLWPRVPGRRHEMRHRALSAVLADRTPNKNQPAQTPASKTNRPIKPPPHKTTRPQKTLASDTPRLNKQNAKRKLTFSKICHVGACQL